MDAIRTNKRPSDALRNAILVTGMSRYSIAKATGVSRTSMQRFANFERSLKLESFDRICEVLGLVLISRKQVEEACGCEVVFEDEPAD